MYSTTQKIDNHYQIIEHHEGWGDVPIMGSGPTTVEYDHEGKALHKSGRKISLCTEVEYHAWLEKNHPTAWAYHLECLDDSMMSSAI